MTKETKQLTEVEKNLNFWNEKLPEQEFSIGFCTHCMRKTVFNRKTKSDNWECTMNTCRERVSDEKIKKQRHDEKIKFNRKMREYVNKKMEERNLK